MIKAKKIDDTHHLLVDELTNDPVATTTAKSDTWRRNKKTYSIDWHPTMKTLYPIGTSSLALRNFNYADSLGSAVNAAEYNYSKLVNGPENPDPLKVVDTGNVVKKTFNVSRYGDTTKEEHNFNEFHIHEPVADKHVATLYVNAKKSKVPYHADNLFEDRLVEAHLKYHGEEPTPEQEEILRKKHPGNSPVSLVNRVKTWLETKDKEPRFVGSHYREGSYVFNTKLPLERAAKEFTEHLKTTPEFAGHTFTELAPNIYRGTKLANDMHEHVIVDGSTPGVVTRSVYKVPLKSERYYTKKLDTIID